MKGPRRFATAEISPTHREPTEHQGVDRALGAEQHEADAQQCAAQLRPHAQPRQNYETPAPPQRDARAEDARRRRAGDELRCEAKADQSSERYRGPNREILCDGETPVHGRKPREVFIPASGDRREARGDERHEVEYAGCAYGQNQGRGFDHDRGSGSTLAEFAGGFEAAIT